MDEAQSARSVDWPAFQEMIALAKRKPRPFDAILVRKLSRFPRNREDAIIHKSLPRRCGVSVVSVNEEIVDTPAGKLLEGIIEVIDEFYSVNLAQDTVRGMKENASRGFHNGGTVPLGYRAERVREGGADRTELALHPLFAPIVERVFRMCLNGLGAKQMAMTLNAESLHTNRGRPWTRNSVHHVLTNETYAGTVV